VFLLGLVAVFGQSKVPFDRQLVKQTHFQDELLERNLQLSQYGRSGSAAIAAMSCWRNGSRSPSKHVSTIAAQSPKYARLPRSLEDELAVASRRSGYTVDVE
jgi:hypothetical protein